MIEKFLIRFCASEVRVMIARMHERPEDFDYGSIWRNLAETRKGFTWAERKVLDREWAKFKKNQKRREVLSLITKEVIDPTPRYANMYDSSRYAQNLASSLANSKSVYAQNIASQYNDPRVMYGQNTIHPQRLQP